MTECELTKLFIEYKETTAKLAELEQQIQSEVLALGESQKVAGVKATYYAASKEYDYEAAAKSHPMVSDTMLSTFTTITKKVRWADVCAHVGIERATIPAVEKPARVLVKA